MVVEILNTVLGLNVSENDWYCKDGSYINYSHCISENDYITGKINVHEFVYKCKIWAFVNGYELLSGTISEDNGDMIFECSIYDKNADNVDNYFLKEFEALNEPEAIFKACEYILEQIKEKD